MDSQISDGPVLHQLPNTTLDDLLNEVVPLSASPAATAARHILAGLSCLVDSEPGSSLIPKNIRENAAVNRITSPVDVAIDWLGHFVQFFPRDANEKDPIRANLEAVHQELEARHLQRTIGQKGMRHIGAVLAYTDAATFNAGVSHAIAATSVAKDRMTMRRLEAVDAMFAKIHAKAAETSERADYYADVDEETLAVHVSAQSNAQASDLNSDWK